MRRKIICILGFSFLACGQGTPGGTINGKAIPENVFKSSQVCGLLRTAIRNEARDQAVKDLGVVVTKEDLLEAKKTVKFEDPGTESKFWIESTQLMVNALTAVDKGQDPQQVYTTMLQPKEVLPEVWANFQKQWKDPKQKEKILARLTMTPDVVARGQAAFDYTSVARGFKLETAVDQKLAASDSTFNTALQHWNTPRPGGGHSIPVAEKQYLDTQREAYWKGQEAKLDVVLNDPTLAQKCGMATK